MSDTNTKIVCVDDIAAYDAYPSDILDEGFILTLDISVKSRATRDGRRVLSNIELLSNQSFFKLAKNSFLAAEKIASELNYINDKIGLNITGLILYPIKITLDTVLLHSKLSRRLIKNLNL